MASLPRVLHRIARPVSVEEFADAVREACPPRHPRARSTAHRWIAIATSGGVDSMALALLFSLLRARDPNLIIGDNPSSGALALVVDHKLRPESTSESLAVVAELSKLPNVSPRRLELNWGGADSTAAAGLETAARRLRYRALGTACATEGIDSLFTGHHADDLHETVLMRMIARHPARGLGGMRRHNDIPECHGLHGVHQSGFLDLMRGKRPPLTYKPSRRDSHSLRKRLLADMRGRLHFWGEDNLEHLAFRERRRAPEDDEVGDVDALFGGVEGPEGWSARPRANLAQLDTEEGGVHVCRPFLGFEKDRLVATCEEHGVRWFEDPTNRDPGLTTRNAVRHMVASCELPAALQRPAILRLAERVRERISGEEEEADELLQQTEILDLRTNSGTMVVELPDIHPGEDLERTRTIAALLARRLINVVSPEAQLPALPSLQGTISRLFPRLATPSHPSSAPPSFPIASVLLTRLAPAPSAAPGRERWHLSRAPYPSTAPLPSLPYHQSKGFPSQGVLSHPKPHWTFIQQPWRLFDGRFWVRLNLRIAGTVTVAPFRPEHAAPFRAALSRAERDRLAALLAHAPGKVRYTLPAVYYDGSVDLERMETKVSGARTLLALPTLGIGLPGLEKVLEWEVRYKRVDPGVLERCHMEVMPECEAV